MQLERNYQPKLIAKLQAQFPGAVILKTDPTHIRSFPDLIIFDGPNWGALETKRAEGAPQRPNQDWWVNTLDIMSFARFANPQNEKEILRDLEYALQFTW